jgi:hypothetical protein
MGPWVRIAIRYGVGGIIGYQVADQLASDPDIVAVATVTATAAVGLITEGFYIVAKRWGWAT